MANNIVVSCKCLNVVLKLVESRAEQLPRFDQAGFMTGQQQSAGRARQGSTTPNDDHFLCFKGAYGPVQCSSVEVQFGTLVKRARIFDDWQLNECQNCNCAVYAECVGSEQPAATSSPRVLINAALMTTDEQLNSRRDDPNYSAAFGVMLNGLTLSYNELAEKRKLLVRASSISGGSSVDNSARGRLLTRLREFMERETEAANERIRRFTEQEYAVLKVKRERAEQDFLILAKRITANTPVPDEQLQQQPLYRSNSTVAKGGSRSQPITGSNTSSTGVGGGSKEQPGGGTITLSDPSTVGASAGGISVGGSQLETPPPTPEYMPMSTGNSPPMATTTTSSGGGSSSNATPNASRGGMDQTPPASSFPPATASSPGARQAAAGIAPNNNYYNNSHYTNNNNNLSFNNTRGAINSSSDSSSSKSNIIKQQSMMMSNAQYQQQQHSSTNHTTTTTMTMQQRLATSGSGGSIRSGTTFAYESDCIFDLDGMDDELQEETDGKQPRPLSTTGANTFPSDEEDLRYEDSADNNNEDGVYIPPPRMLNRQSSSTIAKSLPISMPPAMSQFRANEEVFDELSEDVDIAASIKALARSVHGDTVFGDLPRPQVQRFTTQI